MYKLIAMDLDGTLLNSEGEISFENRDAIKRAKENGIQIVITSGRVSDSVFNIAKEVGADKFFISGNGSMLYDMKKNEIVYENFIDKNKILNLIKMCDENSIYYNIYTEKEVIAKSINYNVAVYNYENTKKQSGKKTRINIIPNLYEYVKNSMQEKYLKMTVCDSNKIIFEGIVKKFKKIPKIDVLDVTHMSRKHIKSGTRDIELNYYYTEITNQYVDKWYALKELAEIENIKEEEIVAIGDNMNDFLMIKKAGFGVAMGNSSPVVKSVANYVTTDNNNNGIANVIDKILKEK